MKTKGLIALLVLLGVSTSGCSLFGGNSSSQQEPETVIVTETVYVTEPTSSQPETTVEDTTQVDTIQSETTDTTQPVSEKKGYTTADVLKKASETADKQYWILYYCDNELRMQSFNAIEGFTVTLKSDKHLKCDRLVGDVTLYYWDEEKSAFSITNTTAYGDWSCNDIIGGNVDVIDEKKRYSY